MYYLYPLNKLKICFQSESCKNIAKSKHSRKFFVSPAKFNKVHVRGFDKSIHTVALYGYYLICIFMKRRCHFPIGILGQVWCLIVSIPDLYPLSYFVNEPTIFIIPILTGYGAMHFNAELSLYVLINQLNGLVDKVNALHCSSTRYQ